MKLKRKIGIGLVSTIGFGIIGFSSWIFGDIFSGTLGLPMYATIFFFPAFVIGIAMVSTAITLGILWLFKD